MTAAALACPVQHEVLERLALHDATADGLVVALKMRGAPSRVVGALNALRVEGLVSADKAPGAGQPYVYTITAQGRHALAMPRKPGRRRTIKRDLPVGIREGSRAAQMWRAMSHTEPARLIEISRRTGVPAGYVADALDKMLDAGHAKRVRVVPGGYAFIRQGTAQ